ncbi:universal stress protein [Subtercola boreus]|uniref:UspA domain-containing protein n=1 Tax=Subtercola boreus TaxID=120213 RepID=A0A3E0WGG0_9MICO|nr:universal stress protein [Subtercola boreus]RFA23251.1 hypothetical protein B7R24_02130 [Subtercola boreus]RFA23324.1 hypothetical protein B7R23_02120 [Subtercola boreus]RFA29127.1 hypothetical protein B7R25_02135 [Subtercola boreus]
MTTSPLHSTVSRDLERTQAQPATTDAPRTSAPVLVGVDGSSQSIYALRRTVRLADSLDAPVRAALIWSPEGAAGHTGAKTHREAERALNLVVNSVFGIRSPSWFSKIVREGSPASVLIEESAGSQMLVVGHHGSGDLNDGDLGSVSAACAGRAHCPVLITHDVRPGAELE